MKLLQDQRDALPDSLEVGLALVFVGTAAGQRSAARGCYYAHPGNRFWRTLHETGLTPRRYEPNEFPQLLQIGIGFTDVAKRAFGMDHEIAREDFEPHSLAAKFKAFQPRAVGFTSKRAASFWLNRPTSRIAYGMQSTEEGKAGVFVLPSPSGAATRYWSIEPWRELAEFIRSKRPKYVSRA